MDKNLIKLLKDYLINNDLSLSGFINKNNLPISKTFLSNYLNEKTSVNLDMLFKFLKSMEMNFNDFHEFCLKNDIEYQESCNSLFNDKDKLKFMIYKENGIIALLEYILIEKINNNPPDIWTNRTIEFLKSYTLAINEYCLKNNLSVYKQIMCFKNNLFIHNLISFVYYDSYLNLEINRDYFKKIKDYLFTLPEGDNIYCFDLLLIIKKELETKIYNKEEKKEILLSDIYAKNEPKLLTLVLSKFLKDFYEYRFEGKKIGKNYDEINKDYADYLDWKFNLKDSTVCSHGYVIMPISSILEESINEALSIILK